MFLFSSSASPSGVGLPPVPSWPSVAGSTSSARTVPAGAGASAAGAADALAVDLRAALGGRELDLALGHPVAARAGRRRARSATFGELAAAVRSGVRTAAGLLPGRLRQLGRERLLVATGPLPAAFASSGASGSFPPPLPPPPAGSTGARRGGRAVARDGGRLGLRRRLLRSSGALAFGEPASAPPPGSAGRSTRLSTSPDRPRQVVDVRDDVLGELVDADALHGGGHHHAGQAGARLAQVERVHRLPAADLEVVGDLVEAGLAARPHRVAPEAVAEGRVSEQLLDQPGGDLGLVNGHGS